MLDYIFIFFWASLLVFFVLLSASAGVDFRRLSILSVVLVYILIFQYLGFPILYFRLDDYRAEFVTEDVLLLKTFALTSLSIVSILFGSILAKSAVSRRGLLRDGARSQASRAPLSTAQAVILWLMGAGCVGVLMLYVNRVGLTELALIVALDASSGGNVELARSKMSNDFGGGYFWYQLFMQQILLYLFLVFVATCFMFRTGGRIGAVVFGASLAFALLMTGEKALIATLVIAIFLSYVFVWDQGKIPMRAAATIAAVVAIIIAMLYQAFSGSEGLLSSVQLVFSRTVTGALQPAYHYVEMFPNIHPYLFGKSLPNPGGVLPFEPFLLTEEVMNFADPASLSRGVVGTMPTIFWGEMYANFGVFGVAASSLFVGFSLFCADAMLSRRLNDPLSIALMVWLMVHYSTLAFTSFSMFIIDIPLMVVLLTVFLVRLFRSAAAEKM
jgi:hypothetical protein